MIHTGHAVNFGGLNLECIASYLTLCNANLFERGKSNEKSGKRVVEEVQTAVWWEIACLEEDWYWMFSHALLMRNNMFSLVNGNLHCGRNLIFVSFHHPSPSAGVKNLFSKHLKAVYLSFSLNGGPKILLQSHNLSFTLYVGTKLPFCIMLKSLRIYSLNMYPESTPETRLLAVCDGGDILLSSAFSKQLPGKVNLITLHLNVGCFSTAGIFRPDGNNCLSYQTSMALYQHCTAGRRICTSGDFQAIVANHICSKEQNSKQLFNPFPV